MDPKTLQIWVAVLVGVVSLITTLGICIRQIGKLISRVNSASTKVDELKAMLYTPDGKHRFVDSSDCIRHRADFEKMIERAIETASLKMMRTIEQDFKATISRFHDRFDEMAKK